VFVLLHLPLVLLPHEQHVEVAWLAPEHLPRSAATVRHHLLTSDRVPRCYSADVVALTIRNVPDEVRDELAARAARSGRSLQEYLAAALTDLASRPSVEDVVTRARRRVTTTGSLVPVDEILAARDADRR
jgi:plasmid stability protein